MDSVMDLILESSRVEDAGILEAVAVTETVLDRVALVRAFAGFFAADDSVGEEGEEEEEARLLPDGAAFALVVFALVVFADPARLAAGARAFLAAALFAPLGSSCRRLAVLGFAGFFAADDSVGEEGEEEEARLLPDGAAFALVFFADPACLAAGARAFLTAAPFLAAAADFFLGDRDAFVVFLDDVAMMLSPQLR